MKKSWKFQNRAEIFEKVHFFKNFSPVLSFLDFSFFKKHTSFFFKKISKINKYFLNSKKSEAKSLHLDVKKTLIHGGLLGEFSPDAGIWFLVYREIALRSMLRAPACSLSSFCLRHWKQPPCQHWTRTTHSTPEFFFAASTCLKARDRS